MNKYVFRYKSWIIRRKREIKAKNLAEAILIEKTLPYKGYLISIFAIDKDKHYEIKLR